MDEDLRSRFAIFLNELIILIITVEFHNPWTALPPRSSDAPQKLVFPAQEDNRVEN